VVARAGLRLVWIKVKKNSYCGKMSLIVFWDYTERCTLLLYKFIL